MTQRMVDIDGNVAEPGGRVRLSAEQLDVATLTMQGEAARRLLVAENFAELAARYGYALAFQRDRAEAIRQDTREALSWAGAKGFVSDEALTKVSYFKQGESALFALIEVHIPVDSGNTILLELIVSGDMPLHVTLEQVSAPSPADPD